MEENNVYAPPKSNVESGLDASGIKFFPVSITKLVVMYVATMGAYALIWFYYNWAAVRDYLGRKVWPLPRSLFYVFFTHSLFRIISQHVDEKKISRPWSGGAQATILVVLVVIGTVFGQITDLVDNVAFMMTALVLSLVLPIVAILPLIKVQRTVNQFNGDPEGAKNARFGVANILWLVFFALVWLGVFAAVAITFGIIQVTP